MAQEKTQELLNPFQNTAHFFVLLAKWIKKNHIFNDYISKNINRKNRKIDFLFVSEHYATIWTKKWKRLFLKEGGGLNVVN